MTPEARARQNIDALLIAAGWHVCHLAEADIHAGDGPVKGVAIREFPLNPGHGFADYLLYVNGKAAGVIEAKKEGATLSGVEVQSARYAQGLPASLPAWRRPLPFLFESTGVETHFTNGLDPQPRARPVFAFFRPELLAQWLTYLPAQGASNTAQEEPGTFLARLRHMPPLVTQWGAGGASYQLWPAQIKAITNLEKSLAANKPKALIQMATGSGKTFTSISFIYRLIKFAGARRVLFLVDRGNLARQTKKEFDAYASPHNNFKFGEEYIVQHLQNNQLDTSARVVICTIQRMFGMLKGRPLPEDADEESTAGLEGLFKDSEPIRYNPAIPIESFDIVVTDEAHRSIYNLWRQVLEYFDAYLIGLTATPNKQTFGFFNQNLVMEYTRAAGAQASVDYELPREAVAEAIVNAVAHRDYTSNASVQVMLFADRLEIWNPGELPPQLTVDNLRRPHASIPRSPRIAEPLFLARYIEKAGTGTLDMIHLCAQAGLPAPEFRQDGGQFIQTLWRPKGAAEGAEVGTKPGTKSGPSRDQVGTKSKSSPRPALARL